MARKKRNAGKKHALLGANHFTLSTILLNTFRISDPLVYKYCLAPHVWIFRAPQASGAAALVN